MTTSQPPSQKRGFLAHTSRAVYGTIVATAVIAAEAAALDNWGPGHFLTVLIATVLILWFAEIYSDVLSDVSDDSLARRIAKGASYHWGVVEPALPLGIPFVLCLFGVIDSETAVSASLLIGVVALGVWGGLASYRRGRPKTRVVLAAIVSASIGVLIIILKSIK